MTYNEILFNQPEHRKMILDGIKIHTIRGSRRFKVGDDFFCRMTQGGTHFFAQEIKWIQEIFIIPESGEVYIAELPEDSLQIRHRKLEGFDLARFTIQEGFFSNLAFFEYFRGKEDCIFQNQKAYQGQIIAWAGKPFQIPEEV